MQSMTKSAAQSTNISTKFQRTKIFACLCLCAVMLCSFSACSKNNTEQVSLYDLNKAMCDVSDFKEMKYVSSQDENAEELLKHVSDIDYAKVEGFFINYAANGTGNADEIACIQVKNKKDINEAVLSLKAHLQTRTGLYSSYDKSQLDKLSNAKVGTHGCVAVLIVGDNSTKMEKAFYDYFE